MASGTERRITAALEDSAAYINRVEELLLVLSHYPLSRDLTDHLAQVARSGAAVRQSVHTARAQLASLNRDGRRRIEGE